MNILDLLSKEPVPSLVLKLAYLCLFGNVLGGMGSCQNINPSEGTFLEAKAKIEHISKGHVTSHGFSGDKITVSYRPHHSNQSVYASAILKSNTYKQGDSVTIYYNPKDPKGTVQDALK